MKLQCVIQGRVGADLRQFLLGLLVGVEQRVHRAVADAVGGELQARLGGGATILISRSFGMNSTPR